MFDRCVCCGSGAFGPFDRAGFCVDCVEIDVAAAGRPAVSVPAVAVSYRKVGGIRFLKLGRLTLSMSVSREYRPIGGVRS